MTYEDARFTGGGRSLVNEETNYYVLDLVTHATFPSNPMLLQPLHLNLCKTKNGLEMCTLAVNLKCSDYSLKLSS